MNMYVHQGSQLYVLAPTLNFLEKHHYTHTNLHTYKEPYLPFCFPSCFRVSVLTGLHAPAHPCFHTSILPQGFCGYTSACSYMHTSIDPCFHTSPHTSPHTYCQFAYRPYMHTYIAISIESIHQSSCNSDSDEAATQECSFNILEARPS